MIRVRSAVLIALVFGAFCQTASRQRAIEVEPESEARDARGALEWRAMTLRGPDGRIPSDGLAKAREHIRGMRVEPTRSSSATQLSSAQLSRAGWRWLGPGNIGGRVRAIAISPANPDTMFAGGVDGGVWRSDDAGDSWRPVDDFMANLAVTAIVINPQNPAVMYAGTGEVYHNYDAVHGGGIFKSTDGGDTWSLLPATSPSFESAFSFGVGRLAMSPDGNVLIAAAGGFFFRSTNGGAGFTRSAQLAPIDVDFDPTSSAKAVGVGYSGAGWYTRDGGVTWQVSSGVPTTPPPGRLEIAYARSQPDTVYLATMDGKLYVSTNGGVSYAPRFSGLQFAQGWYNLTLWVNPRDANHILLGAEQLYESTDGGASFRQISTSSLHVDQHVIVEVPQFDNAANRTIFIGNDGGIYRVDINPGGTYLWLRRSNNLGITQFYGAAGSPDGRIIGGTQDNGTALYRPEAGTTWSPVLDGDGGFCAWDQSDPNFMYMETQNLRLYRAVGGGSPLNITSGITDSGSNNSNFIAPFILDPNDQGRLLAGGRSLWRSTNVKDASHFPTWSNIKSGANESPITAIAVAQGAPDVIWVGHTGGNVYKTLNGTASAPAWTRMFNTFGGTFVTRVTIDPTNFNTVYVSIGGFTKPNIVRSDDGGVSWVDATGSGTTALPTAPVRDVDVDAFDPATIYAATEVGLFVSHDRGATWALPQDGPANVSVDELFFMGSTLVAATHGRGMFAQDLNPQGTESIAVAPDHIEFGTQTFNTQSAPQRVTVTNTGTGPVTIQSIQVAAGDTDSFFIGNSSCVNAVLPPGGTCGFSASFIPRREGPLSAVIDVVSTAPGSPTPITLTGTGVAPTGPPAPWVEQDIGAVGVAGSATFSTGGVLTIKGSGADIWGNADAFHYVYQPLDGDGTIVARVASVQNVSVWTKAGLMIRAATNPGSAHASVFVTPGKGIAVQWRSSAGGTSVNQAVAGAAPKFVRLVRAGNNVAASYSSDGTTWTAIGTVTVTLPQSVLVGMPVASHDNTQTATATIDSVSVTAVPPPGLPAPWRQQDIGAVGVAGSATYSSGTFTIKGSGADIWNAADAFHYVYQPLNGDGTIVARVVTVQNVNAWTKAGVMIRATTDPGSAHASIFVTPGKGIALQSRLSTNGTNVNQQVTGTAPKWVKLVRTGSRIAASYSSDGTAWTAINTVTVTLPQNVLVGLPITSHDMTQLATATLDSVAVTTTALPSPWTHQDIGSVGAAGSAAFANGTFTVNGSGADIWGAADALHYVYQPLSGDVTIQAHVASVENVNVWTKAGLMMRASTDAAAAHVSVFVTPGKGIAMQWRSSAGGTSSSVAVAGVAPTWVRLTRSGSTIRAWYANDGSTWIAIGTATVALPSTASVGLAITSHDNTRTATASVDGVNIT